MQQVILNVANTKYNFLMELLENFDFVQIEEQDGDSREEIATNLSQGFKDLKQIKANKLKTRPLKEFLDEL
jgi:hypothetical protein